MNESARRSIVRVGGTDVHWAELGEGPPVVLIHGLTDSHRTWSRVAPVLARTHRVLMPDLPGHGLSGRPDASYALEWHAKVVGEWFDTLGLERADVIGHSFGGGVAQWLLLDARPRVRRLGLVAAGGLGREVSWSLRLASIPRVVERLGQPFMAFGTRAALHGLGANAFDAADVSELSWMNATPGTARALGRTVRDVIDLFGQRRHFLDRAHEVRELPPIALYWGERDPVIPIEHGAALAHMVDNVSLMRFERCGHFPHRERAAEFVRALVAFVDAPSIPPGRLRRAVAVSAPRAPWWRRAWRAVACAVRRIGVALSSRHG